MLDVQSESCTVYMMIACTDVWYVATVTACSVKTQFYTRDIEFFSIHS